MQNNKKGYPKAVRIGALLLIILLIALYILTLISAIFTDQSNPAMFKMCVYATVAVPFLIYGYMLIYRLLSNRRDEYEDQLNEATKLKDKKTNK